MNRTMVKICASFLFLLICFYKSDTFARGAYVNTLDRIKVDLQVAFQYDESEPNNWKAMFERANELLWNSTEGQIQLGKIDVYINENTNSADVLIASINGGAKANPGGFLGNHGHIYLTQTHESTSGTALGYFGLIHEFGHYGFSLGDEYRANVYEGGSGGILLREYSEETDAFNIDQDGQIASIMDGGTQQHPNNLRTEFSVVSNHRFPFTNSEGDYVVLHQNVMNPGESDWQTMERILNAAGFNIQQPTDLPSTVLPNNLDDIEWIVHNNISQVLAIDRSGSMVGDSLNLAKAGSKLYIDLLSEKDKIAVTSYSSSANVNYGITEITPTNINTVKTTSKSRVNSIVASGSTAIGYGLNTALSQITSQPEKAASEAILLLSDGWHNSGTHPSSYYNAVNTRDVKVYTVALGAGADANLMSDIASKTGGKYYYARYSWEMPGIFSNIYADIHGNNLAAAVTGVINAGISLIDRTQIDPLVDTVKFILNWEGVDAPVFELVNPSGSSIPEHTNNDIIKYFSGDNYKFFVVKKPDVGDWEMEVTNPYSNKNINYSLSAVTKDEGIQFNVVPSKMAISYPDPLLITAEVIAHAPVDGAEVTGIVTRPDGSQGSFVLYDDGLAMHGDKTAYDGVYANYFTGFIGNGSYVFNIEVQNKDGVVAYRAPGLSERSDSTIIPVDPFTRSVKFSVVVSDVPLIINGDTSGTALVMLDNDSRYRCYLKFDCSSQNLKTNGSISFRHSGPTFGKVYMDSYTIDDLSFSPDGKSAIVKGLCRLNGATGYSYKLEVTDNGNPGAQVDTAKITITGPNNYYFSIGEFLNSGDISVSTN